MSRRVSPGAVNQPAATPRTSPTTTMSSRRRSTWRESRKPMEEVLAGTRRLVRPPSPFEQYTVGAELPAAAAWSRQPARAGWSLPPPSTLPRPRWPAKFRQPARPREPSSTSGTGSTSSTGSTSRTGWPGRSLLTTSHSWSWDSGTSKHRATEAREPPLATDRSAASRARTGERRRLRRPSERERGRQHLARPTASPPLTQPRGQIRRPPRQPAGRSGGLTAAVSRTALSRSVISRSAISRAASAARPIQIRTSSSKMLNS